MFDVGFAELVLLFIVGLLILGPERLPKVARTLGGLTRKARSSWLNLKRSIEAEMRAEELKQPFAQFSKDVRSTVSDVNEKVDSFKRDMNADITEPGDAKDPNPPSGDDSR